MKILPQRPYNQTLHESAVHYTLSFKNENMWVLKNPRFFKSVYPLWLKCRALKCS